MWLIQPIFIGKPTVNKEESIDIICRISWGIYLQIIFSLISSKDGPDHTVLIWFVEWSDVLTQIFIKKDARYRHSAWI